ncbi:MAG: GntR family transcriptional regulator [Oscillospiraceae bacterium]|nr:GntR family transcriptional regulator [Oscillospiraceae bacterium]
MDQLQFRQYMDRDPGAKLRDVVTQMLYDEIVSLHIAPGTKLNVNSIASSLGISRTPVAEAIINLCDMGFVMSRPETSGYFVIDLSMTDMINLYDVRSAIECEAAVLCTEHADEETVIELERLANAYRDSLIAKDYQGMLASDMPFHALIVKSCGNKYIQKCYEMLLPNLTMYQSSMLKFISSTSDNPWSSSVTYNHTAIVEAIKMRIPELARQAMENHVSSSLNFTIFYGGGKDPFANVKNPKNRR